MPKRLVLETRKQFSTTFFSTLSLVQARRSGLKKPSLLPAAPCAPDSLPTPKAFPYRPTRILLLFPKGDLRKSGTDILSIWNDLFCPVFQLDRKVKIRAQDGRAKVCGKVTHV